VAVATRCWRQRRSARRSAKEGGSVAAAEVVTGRRVFGFDDGTIGGRWPSGPLRVTVALKAGTRVPVFIRYRYSLPLVSGDVNHRISPCHEWKNRRQRDSGNGCENCGKPAGGRRRKPRNLATSAIRCISFMNSGLRRIPDCLPWRRLPRVLGWRFTSCSLPLRRLGPRPASVLRLRGGNGPSRKARAGNRASTTTFEQ